MRESALGKFNAMAVAVAMAMGTVGFIQDVQAQAQAQLADARQYDIPAGNLADGLKQLSLKGRLQLLAPPELTTGLRGKTVSGTYTSREALDRLLEGTGLSYEFVNSSTVVVKKTDKPPSKAQPSLSSAAKPNSSASAAAPKELDEVTVTGTRIRGGTTPSPVVTIGFERIAEEGFSDLGEVIRSVSQNFSGGQNPEVSAGNIAGAGLANQNITGGSSLNLRGLGPDATLTLLNGRRMSYGGFVQAVDISAIPVEAVERIEIVADGASAIYGSDAVGGVGNVILKRDYEGVMVSTRYGGATDGGMTTREYTVTAGAHWSSGGLIATWKDVSIDPIYADERDYTDHLPDPSTLFPSSDLRSGLISVHQSLGDYAELRLDALRSEREQNISYYNSSLTQFNLTPETTTSLVSPSIEFLLPQDWTLTVGGAWGKDEHNYVQSRVITATGLSTRLSDDCYCNESRTYEAGAEGPLFTLPGGEARLAVGAGYRENEFHQINYLTDTTTTQGEESSRFAYAEINLPLIGPESNIPGVQRLVATAAIRGEDYDSFGNVTTPKFGLIYSSSADLTLKASWGKSFKAPTLQQRFWARSAYLYSATSVGGTGYAGDATALYLYGGDPDLSPERARTWSASVAYHPTTLPGLEIELTGFDIEYSGRVVQAIVGNSYLQSLSNPIYAEFVDYSPTTAQLTDVLAVSNFYNLSGIPYDPVNVVAIVNGRYINVVQQQIQGLDLSGSYRFDLEAGRLTIRGSATWLDSSQQTSSAQDAYNLSGTLFNPAKVTARLGAVWNQGGFSASTFANYKSGVTNTVDNEKSGSFTTFDATLRYATGERGGALSGLEFALSAQNLFDREPPLYTPTSAINVAPYDSTNYSAIGRYLSLSVSKHF